MNSQMLNSLLAEADPEPVIEDVYLYINWVIVKAGRYAMSTMLSGMPGMTDPSGMNTCFESVIGTHAKKIAGEFLTSNETLKTAIGMAALKCVLPPVQEYTKENSIDMFRTMAMKYRTSFIGHFSEAAQLRNDGHDVNIIELFPREGDIHWDDSHYVLGKTEIVFMTGLTLVNNTFDEVIKRTPNARYRIIMGPTVPLSRVLFNYGIHAAGSTLIGDSDSVIRYCQHGGGSIAFAPAGALDKITICKK